MKRIMLLIFLLGLILLSSCNGFQKVNEFSFETIYSDEKIIIKVNDVEWNPGLSKVGGAELRTKKTQQEFMQLLEKQGVNFIWEDLLSSTNIFQINHEGLWSISFKNEENYMQVLILEMSVYIKNDVSIPFPLYGIYKDVLLDEIHLNETYKDVDGDYVYFSLIHFNEIVNAYSKIDKNNNEISLFYQSYQLTLTINEDILKFNISETNRMGFNNLFSIYLNNTNHRSQFT